MILSFSDSNHLQSYLGNVRFFVFLIAFICNWVSFSLEATVMDCVRVNFFTTSWDHLIFKVLQNCWDDLIEIIFLQNHIHYETFASNYPPMTSMHPSEPTSHRIRNSYLFAKCNPYTICVALHIFILTFRFFFNALVFFSHINKHY